MKSLLLSKLNRLAQLAVIGTLALLIGVLTGCGILIDEPANNAVNSSHHEGQSEQSQASDKAANEETTGKDADSSEQLTSEEPITSFAEVAAYIREHGQLPNNFITKNEAKKLGWVAAEGNLHEVAPGMSIGGDRFGNREGLLPNKDGRIWYEADINYEGGRRNADRIVYSNDGLIYMTTDHYKTFTEITD